MRSLIRSDPPLPAPAPFMLAAGRAVQDRIALQLLRALAAERGSHARPLAEVRGATVIAAVCARADAIPEPDLAAHAAARRGRCEPPRGDNNNRLRPVLRQNRERAHGHA